MIDLLKNQKFKKFVEETVNEDNDIDYNEVTKDLNEEREKKLKEKRFEKLNKKRYKKNNSKNSNSKSKDEGDNSNSDCDSQILESKEKELKKANDSHPVIFFYKDPQRQDKIYTYYKTYKNMYYLRFSDRQCCGTATYNTTNGKIEESVKCSKTFENHNYIKESLIRKNLKKRKYHHLK